MSFDITTITKGNCPWRWRTITEWLKNIEPDQLDRLATEYKALFEYIYEKDFNENAAPGAPGIVILNKTPTSITFGITTIDEAITKIYMDLATNEYDGATIPDSPDDPNTEITNQITGGLANGTWVKTGLIAGNHYAFTFSAEDNTGEGVGTADVLVVLPPEIPENAEAIAGTNSGDLDISWDDMNGVVNYTYLYLEGTGKTEEEIVSGGTLGSISGISTTLTLTPSTNYCLIIRANNPGGISDWSDVFEGTAKV